jgi:hypothetical protein
LTVPARQPIFDNVIQEDPEVELAMLLVKNSHPKIGGLQPVVVAVAEGYTKPQGQFMNFDKVEMVSFGIGSNTPQSEILMSINPR